MAWPEAAAKHPHSQSFIIPSSSLWERIGSVKVTKISLFQIRHFNKWRKERRNGQPIWAMAVLEDSPAFPSCYCWVWHYMEISLWPFQISCLGSAVLALLPPNFLPAYCGESRERTRESLEPMQALLRIRWILGLLSTLNHKSRSEHLQGCCENNVTLSQPDASWTQYKDDS